MEDAQLRSDELRFSELQPRSYHEAAQLQAVRQKIQRLRVQAAGSLSSGSGHLWGRRRLARASGFMFRLAAVDGEERAGGHVERRRRRRAPGCPHKLGGTGTS